ncbi:MAG: radical SAM protein [Proteobacteria bacterium]|nr:radical SAM protein [Pseudomonadota bacterium]
MAWLELLPQAHAIKLEILANGIRVNAHALKELTRNDVPISLFEYPSTGGVTLRLGRELFVNAPFDGVFANRANIELDYHKGNGFTLLYGEDQLSVTPLPLPSYWNKRRADDVLLSSLVMTHVDRVRLSPIGGCSFDCQFCNMPLSEYRLHSFEQLREALCIALSDPILPPSHVLISGGTPKISQRQQQDTIIQKLLDFSPLPVDVMIAPRDDDPEFIDRLVDSGVHGLSINLELYNMEIAQRICGHKGRLGLAEYGTAIERAVARTGGDGRVRSILMIGLEPIKETLMGVAWLAERGCDPVLSPFRPAIGTALANVEPPDADQLYRVWCEAREIVDRNGVAIGPRCLPCQHNALAFPYDTGVLNETEKC